MANLTAMEVGRFATREARRRQMNRGEAERSARLSLHVWSMSLAGLGVQLPVWSKPKAVTRPLSPVLVEYSAFRHAHSNAKNVSIDHEIKAIAAWLCFLHSRHRKLRATRLSDVDAFLLRLRRRYAVGTVSGRLSSLRLFYRFLHSTGRLPHDLASSIYNAPHDGAFNRHALCLGQMFNGSSGRSTGARVSVRVTMPCSC